MRSAAITRQIEQVNQTVNEMLLDRSVRHAHYLQRLKTYETNKILRFLNDEYLPRTLEKLRLRLDKIARRGFDLGPRTTQQIRSAVAEANKILQSGLRYAGKDLQKKLNEIGLTEAEWLQSISNSSLEPMGISLTSPSLPLITAAITSRPMQGKLLKDWWKTVDVAARDAIAREIRMGIVGGETTDSIVRRIA